jgi:poly(3-hydroxybutyrate) depolymerase
VLPTLVLPPQAGHDSCIADYSPAQSQLRTILAAGLKRAHRLDLIGATARTRDETIGDYLDVVDLEVDHAGGSVNLIGDCQGGWLAPIYAARHPERINTLTIAGAAARRHRRRVRLRPRLLRAHARARFSPIGAARRRSTPKR